MNFHLSWIYFDQDFSYWSYYQKNSVYDFSYLFFTLLLIFNHTFPMDTSSSIRHRFDVEIPRGKFVKITSILKGFAFQGFHLEIMTSIWHGCFEMDSTFKIDEISMSSARGFFYIVSTSNRRNFCIRCFHSIIF